MLTAQLFVRITAYSIMNEIMGIASCSKSSFIIDLDMQALPASSPRISFPAWDFTVSLKVWYIL